MSLPSRGDLGIILFQTGLPLALSYTDIFDATQSAKELQATYNPQDATAVGGRISSEPFVGAKDAISLFVKIVLAGATNISLKIQGRYKVAEDWADLQSIDESTGTVSSAHTFAADGQYIVQTASAYTTGQIRLVAKYTGAIAAGTQIKVQARTTH
jgi:hypothetical protein